jgi:hypothetical protein
MTFVFIQKEIDTFSNSTGLSYASIESDAGQRGSLLPQINWMGASLDQEKIW